MIIKILYFKLNFLINLDKNEAKMDVFAIKIDPIILIAYAYNTLFKYLLYAKNTKLVLV